MTVDLKSLEWEELPANSSMDFRSINDDWTYIINTTKDPETIILIVNKRCTSASSYQCDEEIRIDVLEEKLNELSWKLLATERLGQLRTTNRVKEQTLKHFHRNNLRNALNNVREYNPSN